MWLLERYGTRLYGYFLATSGSAAEAEDLVQEIFVVLLEKIGHYRHTGRFEQWLFRIAANMARDRARSLARHSTVSLGQSDAQGDLAADMRSNEPEVGAEMQAAEQQAQLQQALNQLSRLDREIIMLRHYGELSFKEIAEQFSLPIGTVLAKVHRGLKTLRKILTTNEDQQE